jgi:hypothetical protein
LYNKAHLVVLTKLDLLPPGAPLPTLRTPDALGVLAVSSATGQGIDELKEFLWRAVQQARSEDSSDSGVSWAEEER